MELSLLLAVSIALGADERITAVDLRRDAGDPGRCVAFYARYESAGSLRGDAFAMLGEGTSPETFEIQRAYGLHLVPGRMRFGPLTREEVDGVRAIERRDDAPPAEMFFVRVGSEQYAAIEACFDEWGAKESFDYPIETEFAHFSERVLKSAGLFPPYRAAFRPFNPIEFYVDLRRLNERMGRDAATDPAPAPTE